MGELSSNNGLKGPFELGCDGSGFAGGVAFANQPRINFLYGGDFGGGAGEKNLVGTPNFITSKAGFYDGRIFSGKVFHHGLTSDAIEYRCERSCFNDPIFHDKKV